MTSSDVTANYESSIHAAYECDGDKVRVQFYRADQRLGHLFEYSRAEAVRVGEEIMNTGIWSDLHLRLEPADVMTYGKRPRDYGRDGN